MKKKALNKKLSLKKSVISNFNSKEVKGGSGSRGCSQTICGSCTNCCPGGPAPTKDSSSQCKCL